MWRSDRGLSVLLGCLVVGILLGMPLVAAGAISPIFTDVAFSLVLISGVASVAGKRSATILVAVFAILTTGVRWVRIITQTPELKLLDTILSLIAIFSLTALVLVRVFQKGAINLHRIQGAAAAYLLLGLGWGSAYELVMLLSPGAIAFSNGTAFDIATLPIKLVYFSFVTLTTLGYGDIVPVHAAARSLAVAEALVGQLYPAILIARLVSLEIISHKDL